jgi:predicted acyltransferase
MNAIAGFTADALVYGPGYSFTARLPNGNTVSWHEFAQAHLLGLGLSPVFASLLYALAAVALCWFLLWLLWRKRIFLKI